MSAVPLATDVHTSNLEAAKNAVDLSLNESSCESDVSTATSSTENLTQEEQFVLRHMRRQDPQGQEREKEIFEAVTDNGDRISASSSALEAASSCRTLIIHGSLSEDSWARIPMMGSVQDLGGSVAFFSSTPNSKCRAGGHHLYSSPCTAHSTKNMTRSLPRSAKEFSALGFYGTANSTMGSMNCIPKEPGCCTNTKEQLPIAREDAHNEQLILERLAREMNLTLPNKRQPIDSYPVSISSSLSQISDNESDAWSRLSMSDTLLADGLRDDSVANQKCRESTPSYTKDFTYLSKPPPAYPRRPSNASAVTNTSNDSNRSVSRRGKVRRALSRSHPDLSKLGKELGLRSGEKSPVWRSLRDKKLDSNTQMQTKVNETSQTDKTSSNSAVISKEQEQIGSATTTADATLEMGKDETVWSTPELVDAILEENFTLRQKVQNHEDNTVKLQKFEEELSAVHASHEALIQSCQRKESLERSVRIRLETELRRMQDINLTLRNQLDIITSQLTVKNTSVAPSSNNNSDMQTTWQKEISRRDALIAQLVSQNKELEAAKERQDIELCTQRATLQQQRSHIEILESALSNAQLHITHLEEECRRKNTEISTYSQGTSNCRLHAHLKEGRSAQNDNCTNTEALAQGAQREIANMEIRIRDLESRLAEKETLIRLLQRASADRETLYGNMVTRLPESVSMLNRYSHGGNCIAGSCNPVVGEGSSIQLNYGVSSAKGPRSCSTSGVCSSSGSSLPSSSRGSATSVASSNGGNGAGRMKPSLEHQHLPRILTTPPDSSSQAFDNQLRALDRFYQNKQSLIQALQSDKERYPNYYWPT